MTVKTQTVVHKTRMRLGVIYLLLWLISGTFAFFVHILVCPDYIKFGTSVFAGFSNLFGPWATIVVKISDFPNAGEFFDLSGALIHTATLMVVVGISMITRKKWVQISCVALFVPVILWWLYLGFTQLASCAI